jgi:hypothetical protein
MVVSGGSRAIATPFLCAPPAMQNSIGSASLPSGPHSASILSTWLCGRGLYRPISKPGTALSFGRDNRSIWRMHMAERHTISPEQILTASIDHFCAMSGLGETQVWKPLFVEFRRVASAARWLVMVDPKLRVFLSPGPAQFYPLMPRKILEAELYNRRPSRHPSRSRPPCLLGVR